MAYSGMAILPFIDNAAITTARQSENAQKASDAATASINLGEATLALRLLKPCAPGERIMAKIPGGCGRITRRVEGTIAATAGNIAAVPRRFRRKR
jgi:hypothetical protein